MTIYLQTLKYDVVCGILYIDIFYKRRGIIWIDIEITQSDLLI